MRFALYLVGAFLAVALILFAVINAVVYGSHALIWLIANIYVPEKLLGVPISAIYFMVVMSFIITMAAVPLLRHYATEHTERARAKKQMQDMEPFIDDEKRRMEYEGTGHI